MADIKLILNMSENWTIWDPNDARSQVDAAVAAEDAGFDGVMFSEHIVLGPGSDANGLPMNIREYAMPGNQSPDFPWPSTVVLMSGVAARTTSLRLIAAAVLAPLRHPLLLAKELGTLDQLAEGRLVILPSVSWHEAEYDALDVPFRRRGDILDEQLEVMSKVWAESPVTHHGEFFQFDDIYLEPKASRPEGVTMWFGGWTMHERLTRRFVKYGSGILCNGPTLDDTEISRLSGELAAVGRDFSEIELVSGIGARFSEPDEIADLDSALGRFRSRVESGYRTFSIKPCQFIDDAADFPAFLDEVVAKTSAVAADFD